MTTTDHAAHRPVIEVPYVEGCPHYPAALALVERVRAQLGVDAELGTTVVTDQAAAEQHRFLGSPTVRVDGRDVEPGAGPPPSFSLTCRLYRRQERLPCQRDAGWVRGALLHAAGGA